MTDLEPIFNAVRRAASLVRDVQRRHVIRREKFGYEPVTIGDYGAQAILCRAIMEHFPGDAVLAEETGAQFVSLMGDEQRALVAGLVGDALGLDVTEDDVVQWLDYGKDIEASRTWLIDPIDGTKGFLKLRHYVVAVGILDDRRPTAAVVAAPHYPNRVEGRLFHAQDGQTFAQPLWVNEDDQPAPERMVVSKRSMPRALRALESAEKNHADYSLLARVRHAAGYDRAFVERADSQEKYARVAAGDSEMYLRMPNFSDRKHLIWDHAPGMALVEGAGGKVTGLAGEPLDFSTGTAIGNDGVIVTNGLIHDALVEATQRVLADLVDESAGS